MKSYQAIADSLYHWYQKNKRELPWRKTKDPYHIWISEVMLQQTTIQAVIPYYERFIKRFSSIKELALAKENEVLEYWSGLGYYSRARNIHRAAKKILSDGFPQTYQQLILLPGFGPYTSRAVSSIAFGEAVGVVDGNVIRVLCRLFNLKIRWWEVKNRNYLQFLSDQIASASNASTINQALMDLGATVCTVQKPLCGICPIATKCKGKAHTEELPLKKPKVASKILLWQPKLKIENKKIALTLKHTLPVLKSDFLFLGECHFLKKKPKKFDFKHSITNHDIYVQVENRSKVKSKLSSTSKNVRWIKLNEVSKYSPSTLVKKAIKIYEEKNS